MANIQKRYWTDRKGRKRFKWRVRWEVGGGRRNRQTGSRTFERLDDAKAWAALVERKRQLTSELEYLVRGSMSLVDALALWEQRVASRKGLSGDLIDAYESNFRNHIHPFFGNIDVRDITVAMVEQFDARLEKRKVGANTRQKVLTRLGAVLQVAVRDGYLSRNVARLVEKPEAPVQKERFALTALQVEQLIDHVRNRQCTPGNESVRLMDAAMIATFAYAGLRGGELRALVWGDIRNGKAHIRHGVKAGKRGSTKTGKTRRVDLIAPLLQDLDEWRSVCTNTSPKAPVFPGPDGDMMAVTKYRNWRRRVFQPAARAIGVPDAVPYSLRHSYVTFLSHEGERAITDIAAQAGHSAKLSLDTYGHAYDEFDSDHRRPLTVQVFEAREIVRVTNV